MILAHQIKQALTDLGGRSALPNLYVAVAHVAGEYVPEASIRAILQKYCSESKGYIGQEDLFRNPSWGVWALRDRPPR